MKLSVSNIGWNKENDELIFKTLQENGFEAIEIAPTAIIDDPYNNALKVKEILLSIKEKYNLEVSSMQSIWYGRVGNIFNKKEAIELMKYTKKAIDFAKTIECQNLVFGCPKNRNMEVGKLKEDIIYFFKELGDYAFMNNTILALEPNPTIYGTNFINYTKEAFDFVKQVNSRGFKVNIDFGTIIENKENLDIIKENIDLVNHVHISEPNLVKINVREEHKELAAVLREKNYDKYVSIEMKKTDNIDDLIETISYVKKIFK